MILYSPDKEFSIEHKQTVTADSSASRLIGIGSPARDGEAAQKKC
jgi:hypothetical protein